MNAPAGNAAANIVKAILLTLLASAVLGSYSATAQALLQTGMQAPEFELKDVDGRAMRFTGAMPDTAPSTTTVVVFWSTWSAKNKQALKRFEDFHKKYKDKGIRVIGVNADNQTLANGDVEAIKAVIAELNITFPMLLDKGLRTFHDYHVIALPSTVVVSGGKISFELAGFPLIGAENLFDYLRMQAGEPVKAKIAAGYKPRHDAIADANLARGFVKKKRREMAYPLFLKAIEKDPRYLLPYIELARLYDEDGKGAEAEQTLRNALAQDAESVVVMSDLGYLLSRTGKVREAVEVLDKAVKRNSYTPSHYFHAYALYRDGRLKEALSAFEQAVELNPYEPAIYSLRAEVYENSKMPKEAAEDYRKALALMLKLKE